MPSLHIVVLLAHKGNRGLTQSWLKKQGSGQLAVVAYHAGLPVPGGFIGVDVFFVISGFVITSMLHRDKVRFGRIRFGQFFLRRFKRLTPALALVVTVTMIISIFVLSPLGSQQVAASTGIGAMLLFANFVISRNTGGYFDGSSQLNPLLNTWSLSVEDQFYLVFPVVIALGWYLARRGRRYRLAPILLITTLGLSSFALALLGSFDLTFRGSNLVLGFYSPITRGWEFAVGALLSLVLTTKAIRSQRLLTVLGILGSTMLVASLWLINESTPFPGIWTLLPVAGTLLLLLAGSQKCTPTYRLLAARPCVMVGDWSYSIYLWHWPLIVFAGVIWPGNSTAILLSVAISFAPALMSYYWVEQPLRVTHFAERRVLVRSSLLILGSPLILCLIVLWANDNHYWSSSVSEVSGAVLADHAGFNNGCFSDSPNSVLLPEQCVWNRDALGDYIYLVGDSHADHFTEAVVVAGELLDRPIMSYTKSGCPFFDVWVEIPSRSTDWLTGCRNYYADTLAWLMKQTPGLVVTSASDFYWLNTEVSVGAAADSMTNDVSLRSKFLRSGLKSTILALESSGHQVLVVNPVPQFSNPYVWEVQNSCTLLTLMSQGARGCFPVMPLSHANQVQSLPLKDFKAAIRDTGATEVDLRQVLCPNRLCGREKIPKWKDGSHLSVPESRALGTEFAALITSIKVGLI